MAVKVFISHDPNSSNERAFRWAHERLAAIDLVKLMWIYFSKSPKLYAILVNVSYPPADALVIKEDGIGIIEFKNYSGMLSGRETGPWVTMLGPGHSRLVEVTNYDNPFQQVQNYRDKLQVLLSKAMRPSNDLPRWLIDYLHTTVCFTGEANWNNLHINQPRFAVTNLNYLPSWIYSLACGEEKLLSWEQIEWIMCNLLKGQEWKEIEEMRPSSAPYGRLQVMIGVSEGLSYPLDREDLLIGRAENVGTLALDGSYRKVSRFHAHLRRQSQGVMIIDGHGGEISKNGTFVDGKQINSDNGYFLKDGCTIVLGGYDTTHSHRPAPGACVLKYFETKMKQGNPLISTEDITEGREHR